MKTIKLNIEDEFFDISTVEVEQTEENEEKIYNELECNTSIIHEIETIDGKIIMTCQIVDIEKD